MDDNVILDYKLGIRTFYDEISSLGNRQTLMYMTRRPEAIINIRINEDATEELVCIVLNSTYKILRCAINGVVQNRA